MRERGIVGPTSITSEKSIADKYALVAARWLGSLYLQPGTPMHPTAMRRATQKAKSEKREFTEVS